MKPRKSARRVALESALQSERDCVFLSNGALAARFRLHRKRVQEARARLEGGGSIPGATVRVGLNAKIYHLGRVLLSNTARSAGNAQR